MKKKVISVLVAWVFVLLSVFLVVVGADAFCVYNKTDTNIGAKQVGLLQGMDKDYIPPGGSECCHWSNKDCNPGGKRDSNVTLRIGWSKSAGPFICEVKIKAGGWLNVIGKIDEEPVWKFKCEAHYSP